MKKRLKSLFAAVLSIALMLTTIPIAAKAAESPQVNTQQDIATTEEEPYIVSEVVEKREEYSKCFLMSDRSYMAAVYQLPVHYQKDNKWVDIDNSFISFTDDETNDDIFATKNNPFEIKFAKKSKSNNLVSLQKDNHKIKWSLNGAQKVSAKTVSSTNDKSNKDLSSLKNLTGTVIYEDILKSVDLKYTTSGKGVKEDIILKNAEAPLTYTFNYKLNNLKYRQLEDGSIEFFSSDNEEKTVFVIQKPYMYDADQNYSDSILLDIKEGKSGIVVELCPDQKWLSDKSRSYPVVIDPSIISSQKATSIKDIYISTANINNSFSYITPDLLVGSESPTRVYRSIIKVDLPDMSKGSRVVKALLNVCPYITALDGEQVSAAVRPRPSGNIAVEVRRVTQDWGETSATWLNDSFKYPNQVDDYFTYSSSNTTMPYQADITRTAAGWYDGTYPNYGVMLMANNENVSNQLMQFCSSDYGTNGSNAESWRPIVQFYYRNFLGTEDYWNFSSQDMGRSGTGNVNNFNGNLVYSHTDAINTANNTGFTLSHVYNSALAGTGEGRYGDGWQINMVQKFEPLTVEQKIETNAEFVYTDGDGTKHYFIDYNGKIIDEDGLGYTYEDINEGELQDKITDKDGNVLKFDYLHYLRSITDVNGNTITLQFAPIPNVDNYLRHISTSTGDFYDLQYDNSYKLIKIVDNAGRETQFNRPNGKLTEIIYPDQTSTAFSYDDSGYLSSVKSISGQKVEYTYQNKKVWQVTAKDTNEVTGAVNQYSYSYNQTKIYDSNNRTTVYHFDNYGRPVDMQNYGVEGNTEDTYGQYFAFSNGNINNNKLTSESKMQQSVINLLENHSFERDSFWEPANWWNSSTGSAGYSTSQKYMGSRSGYITKTDQVNGSRFSYSHPFSVPSSGGTYTFSGYIKTSNISNVNGGGASIMFCYTDIDGNGVFCVSDLVTGTTDWQRYSVTATIPGNARWISVSAQITSESGTAYFDCMQMEKGDSVNRYNIVENASFEQNVANTADFWADGGLPRENSETVVAGVGTGGGNAYQFQGKPTQFKGIGQWMFVGGNKGDALVLSCMVKGIEVPDKSSNNESNFGIEAAFRKTDGVNNVSVIKSTRVTSDGWQYMSFALIAPEDYCGLTIYLKDCYGANTVYFDDICLYKDEFGNTYTYDNNGNVVSSSAQAKQESTFQYSDNNLSKVLNPSGSSYEYSYDGKKNITTANSSQGVQYDIAYDSYGNVVKSTTQQTAYSGTIQSGKSYRIRNKHSGKYLTTAGANAQDNVYQGVYSGGNNQIWTLSSNDDGTFTLKSSLNTNLVLDVDCNSADNGTNIKVYYANSSPAQRYKILLNQNYTYRILTGSTGYTSCVENAGVSLDDGANVQQWNYVGANSQVWHFEDISIPAVTEPQDGVYMFRACHSGKYLDVRYGSTALETPIQQFEYNNTLSQKYEIKRYQGTEYFTISPLNSPDKILGANTTRLTSYNCKTVALSTNTINDTKLFKFVWNSTRSAFNIVNKAYLSECIDIGYAGYANETEVSLTPTSTADANQCFYLEKISESITGNMEYKNNGGYLTKTTDSRGNDTHYNINTDTGLLDDTINANGVTTLYSYNQQNDRLDNVTIDGKTVSYIYENTGALKQIKTPNNTQYNFTYDTFGRSKTISVGTQKLSESFYQNNHSALISRFEYGNGVYKTYNYDNLDRLLNESINGAQISSYTYDKMGSLARSVDFLSGITSRFTYDLIGRLVRINKSNGQMQSYSYDNYNRIANVVYKLGATSLKSNYIYGDIAISDQKTDLIYGVKLNDIQRIAYNYDALCRMKKRTIQTETQYVTEYGYLEGGTANETTTLIKSVKNGIDTLTYTYDNIGNIKTISKNGALQSTYHYDYLNQLYREDNNGKNTIVYVYDAGGNIQSKNTYAYTDSQTQLGTPDSTISYGYGDTNWKDKMTSYNGMSITYDAIGNPLQYRDDMIMTWQNGRQLATITQETDSGTNTYTYTYDKDGLRTSKTINGTTTDYYRMNGVLQAQKTGEEYLYFLYDENGTAYGLLLKNGATENYFYYIFNAQGDVIGIVDSSGAKVVEYTYDTWGACTTGQDTSTCNIGTKNPLRYRGYYYDAETELYYVSSRYYDPETCRFINADGLVSTGQGLNGNNMFAYCGNNPVNNCDPTGCGWVKNLVKAAKKLVKSFVSDYSVPKKSKSKKSNANSLSINDFKNIDNTYSLYDSRRNSFSSSSFYEQAFWGGVEGPKKNSLNLVTAKAGVYRGAGDYKYGRFDFSMADASVGIGLKESEAGIYGKASLLSGGIAGKIPTPWGTLIIGGEAQYFSIGAGITANSIEDGFKLKAGYSLGVGGDIIIEWDPN